MYRICAIILLLAVTGTACAIAAYQIAWSDWAQSEEWLSYERAQKLIHKREAVTVGAKVSVAGRRGTVTWDGRPVQPAIKVKWADDGSNSGIIPVNDVKDVDELPVENYRPIEDHVLYIGIISPPINFDQRDTARRTWVNAAKKYLDGRIKVEFLIGQVPIQGDRPREPGEQVVATEDERNLETHLQAEARLHGDISRIPVVETALFQTDKVLWVLSNAVYWQARFVMKANDDQIVDVEFIMEVLQKRSPIAQPSYFGKVESWHQEQVGEYCLNYKSVDTFLPSKEECQDRCGESCVGISYSSNSRLSSNCLLCSDDTLHMSIDSTHFGFYRKPVWDAREQKIIEGKKGFFHSRCYGISGDLAHKISASHMRNSNRYADDDISDDAISMAKWIEREDEVRMHYDLLPVKHLLLPHLCHGLQSEKSM